MKNRIAATGLPILGGYFAAWLGGFDFTTRGPALGWLAFFSMLYCLWQWYAPWWRK